MSHHGLLTTVAYQLGPNKPVTYALEVGPTHWSHPLTTYFKQVSAHFKGAVLVAGQSVRWLRDNMEFFKDASEIGG